MESDPNLPKRNLNKLTTADSMKVRIVDEVDGLMRIEFKETPVCVMNALRRTITGDIKTVGILPSGCVIRTNTSTTLSNEIIIERLRAIPVHTTELVPDVTLTIQVANTESELRYVTTKDFVTGGRLWYPIEECVVDDVTYQLPHDLLPLKEGEKFDLSATFSIVTATDSGVYSVASDCFFEAMKDDVKAEEAWRKKGSVDPKEKHDFDMLTAHRYVHEDCFMFNLRTKRVHSNLSLMRLASERIIEHLQSLEGTPRESDCMPDCVDVVLTKTDYTIGMLLEYTLFSQREALGITFVSFYKHHPYDVDGLLRIACKRKDVWKTAVPILVDTFESLLKLF